jgi:hypothetical protein
VGKTARTLGRLLTFARRLFFPMNDSPRLTPENHRTTSPSTPDYNCIAWSADDTRHWWQPGLYWPVQAPEGDYGISVLEQAFAALGYEACDDGTLD